MGAAVGTGVGSSVGSGVGSSVGSGVGSSVGSGSGSGAGSSRTLMVTSEGEPTRYSSKTGLTAILMVRADGPGSTLSSTL